MYNLSTAKKAVNGLNNIIKESNDKIIDDFVASIFNDLDLGEEQTTRGIIENLNDPYFKLLSVLYLKKISGDDQSSNAILLIFCWPIERWNPFLQQSLKRLNRC